MRIVSGQAAALGLRREPGKTWNLFSFVFGRRACSGNPDPATLVLPIASFGWNINATCSLGGQSGENRLFSPRARDTILASNCFAIRKRTACAQWKSPHAMRLLQAVFDAIQHLSQVLKPPARGTRYRGQMHRFLPGQTPAIRIDGQRLSRLALGLDTH